MDWKIHTRLTESLCNLKISGKKAREQQFWDILFKIRRCVCTNATKLPLF